MNTIISASILSADVCRLGEELDRIRESGCGHVHFDVMDGIFVPNISFGVPVLKGVRKYTDMFVDVHLMITDPLRYVKTFADAGADMITFHIESDSDPEDMLRAVKSLEKRAGIALKPGTPASEVLPYIELADNVLVMTVEPGFGGQTFMYDMLDKIRELREYIDGNCPGKHIQVDGGINAETAALVQEAGADILVAGSYLFADDMAEAVESML